MPPIATIAFWFAVGSLLLLTAILLFRRTYRELPFFFIYVVYDFLGGSARALPLPPKVYFYVFWFTEFAGLLAVILAVCEVFLKRLFPGFFRIRFYRLLLLVGAIVIPVVSIQIALQAPDKRAALMMMMRGYDTARAAVLVLVVALMIFMGRSWNRYDFGILFGFAVQAAAAVVNGIARAQAHYKGTGWDNVEALAYCVSCLIWLITFLKPEKRIELQPLDQTAAETLHQARTWQSALKDWLTPGKRSL